MATHNINKITVPNGDIYNLLDSGRSDFVTKSGLLTSTGTSTDNTMTQAAITNAIANIPGAYILRSSESTPDSITVNFSEIVTAVNENRPVYLILGSSSRGEITVYHLSEIQIDVGDGSSEYDSLCFSSVVNSGESRYLFILTWNGAYFWDGPNNIYLRNYQGTSPISIQYVDGIRYNIIHADSGVTAQTTQALYPFTVNATGHITGVGSAITSMTPTSHTHGNITDAGDITTNATIASGDRLVINDESASKLTNSSITFGTSTTQFLANNGTWQTPAGGVTDVQVNGTSILSSGTANLVTNTAYNASTNKLATMADVDVMTITYSLISGTDYEMNISTVLAPNYASTILGEEY